MSDTSITDKARKIAQDICSQLDYSLWDVTYQKRGHDYYLSVTIDKEDGISIDDCEAFHRLLDAALDKEDIIENSYMLEVSSPGIERVIRTDEHYEWAKGQKIDIRLYNPVDKTRKYTGILIGSDDSSVIIDIGNNEIQLDRKNISSCSIHFDF